MPYYDRAERAGARRVVFLNVVTGRATGAIGIVLMGLCGWGSFRIILPYLPPAPDAVGVRILAFLVAWYGMIAVLGLVFLLHMIRGRRIEVAVRDEALG